jgi:hypothetical protein
VNAIISNYTRDQIVQWTIIVAGLTAVGVFVRWVYRGAKSVKEAAEFIKEAAEFIKHELQENSGRSQKDYAIRNDRRVEFLFQHQGIEMPDDMKSPPEQH